MTEGVAELHRDLGSAPVIEGWRRIQDKAGGRRPHGKGAPVVEGRIAIQRMPRGGSHTRCAVRAEKA